MTAILRNLTPVVWSQARLYDVLRNLTPVVWTQPPGSGAIRSAQGSVLMMTPPGSMVRQVTGSVLQPARKLPTLAASAAILALVNSEAKSPFTSSQISIGEPAASNAVAFANTTVVVTALPGSGYLGTCNLYYSRIPVSSVFVTTTQWLLGSITTATTLSALLPQINTLYGTYLDVTDIVDQPVPVGTTKLTITIAATSYVYQPGTQVQLENTVALTTAIATTALNGFQDARGNLVDPSLASVLTVTALGGFANAQGVGPSVFNNTVALFHFDGANGSQVIKEESGQVVTVNGSAALSTAQSKFGGSSLLTNAANAYVSIADSPSLQFTTDMTIEYWQYLLADGSDQVSVSKGEAFIEIYFSALQARADIASVSNLFNGLTGLALNQWQHIALVRKGSTNTYYIFINGALIASVVSALPWGTVAGSPFCIGGHSGGTFTGMIDELRISKIARYTASFTPQTAPFLPD